MSLIPSGRKIRVRQKEPRGRKKAKNSENVLAHVTSVKKERVKKRAREYEGRYSRDRRR